MKQHIVTIVTLVTALTFVSSAMCQQPTQGVPFYRLIDKYDFSGGLNTAKMPHRIADNEASFMENAVLNDSLMLTKRPGPKYFNSSAISGNPIWGLYRYYKRNGTKKFMAACNGSLWVWNASTQKFVELKSGVTTDADNQWRWVTYADRAFGFNGTDAVQVYDGYSNTQYIYDCGIPAPTIDPTKTDEAAHAGGLSQGTYQYKYSYYDSSTGTESNGNPTALSVTLASDDRKVEVTMTDSSTANRSQNLSKKLYRSEMGGSVFYYLAEIDYGTATYWDTTPDDELPSTQIPTTNDQPPTFSDICAFKGQLIGIGDPNYPERVYFSSLISNQGPECWPPTAYENIDTDDGSVPVRIIVMGDEVFVFTETRIYRLVGGAWTATDKPTVRPVRSSTGTVAPWSVVNANGVLIYLTRIGEHLAVYTYGGSLLNRLSDNIEPELDNIVPAKIKYATSSYVDKRYRMAYQDERSAYGVNNRVFEYHVPTGSWWPLTGLYINCWSYWGGAGDEGELYFGDSRDGMISEYGQAARDPEMAIIPMKYRTKYYDLGSPQVHKRLRYIYLDFVKGLSNKLGYKLIIDYGKDDVEGTVDLKDYIAPYWNEMIWNEFYWAGDEELNHKVISLPKKAVSRRVAIQWEDPAQ